MHRPAILFLLRCRLMKVRFLQWLLHSYCWWVTNKSYCQPLYTYHVLHSSNRKITKCLINAQCFFGVIFTRLSNCFLSAFCCAVLIPTLKVKHVWYVLAIVLQEKYGLPCPVRQNILVRNLYFSDHTWIFMCIVGRYPHLWFPFYFQDLAKSMSFLSG